MCVVFQKPTNEGTVEKTIWSILKHSKFNPFRFKPRVSPPEPPLRLRNKWVPQTSSLQYREESTEGTEKIKKRGK